MKKKCLLVMLVFALISGTYSIALAADEKGGATGRELKSYGKIAYQNGEDKVVIDSEDFKILADRLDLFKRGISDQLNAINTYFTTEEGISLGTGTDIHVTHTRPSEEKLVDPLGIDFDTLLEGVAASQSVPSDVSAAVAGNLSAGTAAWVDGHLILGTGADNQSHYQKGYEEGAAAGSGKPYNKVELPTTTVAGNMTYTAPRDMKDVVIYYYSRPEYVTMNFSPRTNCQVLVQAGHDIESGRVCNVIYVPELKAGTVLTYHVSGSNIPVLFYK